MRTVVSWFANAERKPRKPIVVGRDEAKGETSERQDTSPSVETKK